MVGAAGEPHVTCNRTISVGASVQNALAAASPGQVVCLSAGSWSVQDITGLTPSGMITLAAAPGAAVSMAGLTITGQTNNLTIEGINWTGQFYDGAGVSNIVFQHNTMENLNNTWAIYSYPRSRGAGGVANGVQVLYNQIDHVENCAEIDGGSGMQLNWTFSHNVCGPGIGAGGSMDSHYLQAGGISGITIDNNAFEGPFDSSALAAGAHNNVIHLWGGQSNIQIENNIIWHTQSRAQTILLEQGPTDNVTIKNNLDVEDPSNFTDSNIYTMAWDVNHAHGETIENNTADHPYWGTLDSTGGAQSGDYSSTTNQMVDHNIVAPNAPGGNSNFSLSCDSACTHANNVSGDGSAPGPASVTNWAPRWQAATWTPNNGSPWNPPPPNYYKPSALSGSFGYQETIGP